MPVISSNASRWTVGTFFSRWAAFARSVSLEDRFGEAEESDSGLEDFGVSMSAS